MNFYGLLGIPGIFGLMLLAWLFSASRRNMNWRVIAWGAALQLALAAAVCRLPGSRHFFALLNDAVMHLLSAATAGQEFVFGNLGKGGTELGFILAFEVFPLIIFFSALMGLLYYWRILPAIIRLFAFVFTRLMRISGAESLCVASNIFVGIESVTAIRPFLAKMTRSEFCTILTAGMATVASSMMALYVIVLKDVFAGIAGHLISASIMSAPAALVMSKILLPENEQPETLGINVKLELPQETSAMEAVINGAMAGVKLVLGIAAVLIAFLGLLSLTDMLLGYVGRWFEIELSLRLLLGYVFYPLTLLIGIAPEDAHLASNLIGLRLAGTEVAAYYELSSAMTAGMFKDPRSPIIIAYSLCGFAHIASLAIFMGGIAALVPERARDVISVGWRALFAANLACLMTGAVIGVFSVI